MKKLLSLAIVLSLFILAKQSGPNTKVYYAGEGLETSDITKAFGYTELKAAYNDQIKLGGDWEIINCQ